MQWDRPLSLGYATYFPPVTYQIAYYRVEAAHTESFAAVLGNVTCVHNMPTVVCNFDELHRPQQHAAVLFSRACLDNHW